MMSSRMRTTGMLLAVAMAMSFLSACLEPQGEFTYQAVGQDTSTALVRYAAPNVGFA